MLEEGKAEGFEGGNTLVGVDEKPGEIFFSFRVQYLLFSNLCLNTCVKN